MSMLLESAELFDPIAERLEDGLPVLGTCAGMILLATGVLGGRADQRSFGALDIEVRRNGFGRQVDSFEADLTVTGLPGSGPPASQHDPATATEPEPPLHAVFIRAPVVERCGPTAAGRVEVLAAIDGRPVLVRRGPILAASFHPELGDDPRIHQAFVAGAG